MVPEQPGGGRLNHPAYLGRFVGDEQTAYARPTEPLLLTIAQEAPETPSNSTDWEAAELNVRLMPEVSNAKVLELAGATMTAFDEVATGR